MTYKLQIKLPFKFLNFEIKLVLFPYVNSWWTFYTKCLEDYKVNTTNFNFLVTKHIINQINGYPLPSVHTHKILIDFNGSCARLLRALKFETLWCFQNIFEVQFLRRNTMVKKQFFQAYSYPLGTSLDCLF